LGPLQFTTKSLCLLLSAASVLLLGCAGYKLGPTNGEVAGARSIQVHPFHNTTMEPRLSDAMTSALRKRLQQDGTYRLDSRSEADLEVHGVITRFERNEAGFQPNDILTVRDYQLLVYAHIIVLERSSGKTNINQQVFGRTTIRVGSDLASAERQAVPLLAAELARNAASVIVDGRW
jgi:hypothetical protein